MKKPLLFIIYLTLISCGNNKYEKQIIGTWYSLGENEKLEFNSDSLFVNDLNKIGTWKADKEKIEYKWKYYHYDSIKKSIYQYQLKSEDSLLFKLEDSLNPVFTFLKSESFIDFIFKKNNVFINLEKNTEAESHTRNRYGIKVFAYKKNNIINVKTEYSENIQNLDYDLKMILSEINPFFTEEYNSFPEHFKQRTSLKRWTKMKVHYQLFADKNVPKDSIKAITKKLKKSQILNVYQVFETKEIKYYDFNHLKTIKL